MSNPSTPLVDVEKKGAAVTTEQNVDASQYSEGLGDLQVLKVDHNESLKLASDGKTVLIPQPSDDPNDPLNWSFTKKHVILAPLIFASLVRTQLRAHRWVWLMFAAD